ncbi:LysR family transcriptional regulator [Exilibacterium tricleocarpae]|uniref:LysR family transcriptional regulator n=1 Tax=Exilibacterium tricleocarpae TaxID=2591008 RepID=A0A545T0K6_9GAMM|nr:LysR family transcriptional regulator [Exilibacterium tricleocarpae]TQV70752.1 LysR family transcriptional regulator [Exilibacterium tricleocarpae]
MIDLRQLRHFIAVAEELHFHRAAKRLNMSQPPLTATVRRLEDEIGAELLERGNRIIRLTPAGKALLVHARLTVEQADLAVAAARDAAAGRVGTLRVSYVGSAMYGRLATTVRAFRRSFPNVRLELKEATTAAQVMALREGTSDVAVLVPPLPDAAGLNMIPFDEDCFAIALPAAHKLAGKADVTLSDVADEPFVMWPAAEGRGFHTQVVQLCAAEGFVPQVVQEAHQIHGVLALVAIEIGVSVVPASMTGFRAGEIVYRPLTIEGSSFTLFLCHRDEAPGTVGQNFLEIASR